MSAWREWVMETVPNAFSAWLLAAYRRPLLFLLTVVILPLVLVFVAAHIMNVSLWRTQTLSNLHVTARLAAEIVNETLEETFRFEQQLAADPDVQDALRRRDAATLAQHLAQAIAFAPRVDLALAFAPDGQVIAATPESSAQASRSVTEEEPFRGAQAGGWHPYVSAVYLREGPDIEKVVGVVWPVTDPAGRVLGALQFQHRVEEVKSWLQKIRVEPGGFLYVVDHHDQLVVFPFQVLPGKPKVVSDWPTVSHPLSESGGTLIFTGRQDGARWLAGMALIGDTGWRVVAVQPERAALRVLYRLLWLLGFLIALLALLLVGVSMRWAQVQALSLRLLHQNTKLLKQTQQKRTLDRLSDKEPQP